MSTLSQSQKIITYMLRVKKDWFYPFDFMQADLGDLFVGYEASARLSELARKYPDMIETKQDGKYKMRKLNISALRRRMAEHTLDQELREVVVAEAGIALF